MTLKLEITQHLAGGLKRTSIIARRLNLFNVSRGVEVAVRPQL